MNPVFSWILARAKEPSTYAGLAGLALAFGLNDSEWAAVSTALAAVFGAIAVFVSEKMKVD